MPERMLGLSKDFIADDLARFPNGQMDMLQEECAELILACSKVKRYPADSYRHSNLIEEMADVLIVLTATATGLGITENDILEEANKKAKKYGFSSAKGDNYEQAK